MKKTKPITVDAKVMINWLLNPVLYKETGTVIRRDEDDSVVIKLDRITEVMKGYDDAKTGVVNVDPVHVVVL